MEAQGRCHVVLYVLVNGYITKLYGKIHYIGYCSTDASLFLIESSAK